MFSGLGPIVRIAVKAAVGAPAIKKSLTTCLREAGASRGRRPAKHTEITEKESPPWHQGGRRSQEIFTTEAARR